MAEYEGADNGCRAVPTIKAVPVVRCKECKWYVERISGEVEEEAGRDYKEANGIS